MAEKYDQKHILQIPDLLPVRHYETDGMVNDNHINTSDGAMETEEPLIRTLAALDKTYTLADLLPDDVAKIIKDITGVLQKQIQGMIIEKITDPTDDIYDPTPENNPDYIFTPDPDPDNIITIDDDIFSTDPGFEIITEAADSLLDLARNAYEKDYQDVMEHYTTSIEQIVHRFFQMMTTLADDSNMPDYTYLMKNFDGKAVAITDQNLQHLKDAIVKYQLIRDQKTRQMQKTHTAENTLIYGRSWLSAEKQKERYLSEDYKKNTSALSTTMGNNLLLGSRNTAKKKYDMGMYNMYKYLNSAVAGVSNILDARVDEASAKGQLALNGADIFAATPEPQPTATKVDNNSTVTDATGKSITKQLNEQAAGATQSNAGGDGDSGDCNPHVDGGDTIVTGAAVGSGSEIANAIASGTGYPARLIWAQLSHESAGFTQESGTNNWGGEKDTSNNYINFANNQEFIDYMVKYYPKYAEDGITGANTVNTWVAALKHGGYFTDAATNYARGMVNWLQQG